MTNILAIYRPSSTDFEAAYTVTTDENRAFVEKINIANVAGVEANYSIAIVLSDETANEDNAQAWNVKIPSGAHRFILIGVPLAINTQRSGKSIGIGLSIPLIEIF